jgi:Cu+-exporting ATPase
MTTAQPNQTVHDVICHMDISVSEAAGRSDYEGRTYYFCAMGCKRDFDDDPEAALTAEAEYDHSAAMDNAMATSGSGAPARKPWWKFWG